MSQANSTPGSLQHRRYAGRAAEANPGTFDSGAAARAVAIAVESQASAGVLPSAVYLNAAHELRAPLARMLDQIDSLSDPGNGALSPAQSEIARNIFSTCLRMQRLVEDCFSYGRMISGEVSFSAQFTDMQELFTELASAWQPAFGKKGVALRLAPPAEAENFPCDPHKLMRSVSVLMENALKFTPEGGEVELSWRRCDGREMVIPEPQSGKRPVATVAPSEDWPDCPADGLCIRVRDTGCGIAPEEQGEIFKPFVRLHQHNLPLDPSPQPGTSKYRRRRDDRTPGMGLGLGLAVAWRLVQLHNGRIWVESEPGHGSTFTILLPPALQATVAAAD